MRKVVGSVNGRYCERKCREEAFNRFRRPHKSLAQRFNIARATTALSAHGIHASTLDNAVCSLFRLAVVKIASWHSRTHIRKT